MSNLDLGQLNAKLRRLQRSVCCLQADGTLPDQTGHAGEFLSTDGTDPFWTTNAGGDITGATNLGGGLANFDSKIAPNLQFNTFNATDFNLASNLISIDYANGQAATALQDGFLQAADWTTFNNKGDVHKVGTPVNDQIGVWTGDGTIEGDAALTYNSTTDTLTSVNFAGNLTGTITPTGFTAGSVIFAGVGGTLSQDNANFFFNNTTDVLNIGTTTGFSANTPSASIFVGTSGGLNGNITGGGGLATLGKLSAGSYGAVGSNFYLNSAGLLKRIVSDVVAAIDFNASGFVFKNAASGAVDSTISPTTLWTLSGAGHWLAGTDNIYDIGAVGATRPRTEYLGTSLGIGSLITTTPSAPLEVRKGTTSDQLVGLFSNNGGAAFKTFVNISAGADDNSTSATWSIYNDPAATTISLRYGNSRVALGSNVGFTTDYLGQGSLGTSLRTPLVLGGTTTTSTLTLQSTSGVGTTGADIIFKVGNNGSLEVERMFNDGHAIYQKTPVAVATYGTLNIGALTAFDGATAGFFTGAAAGVQFAINAASGSTADLANWQVAGVPKFVVTNGLFAPSTGSTAFSGVTMSSTHAATGAASGAYKPLNITYTINNTGGASTATATGIFLNATETALNGMGHNLMNLQVGGVGLFTVDRIGAVNAGGTISSGSSLIAASNIQLGNASILLWAGRSVLSSPSDGVIRLTDNAQATFNRLQLGGTTSSFPSIKRVLSGVAIRLADDSGDAVITASVFGVNGTPNGIYNPGGNSVGVLVNSTQAAYFDATNTRLTNNLIFTTDNTYDVGASGATRPRDLHLARNLVIANTGTINSVSFGGIAFSSDGVWRIVDNAGTSFGRLQLGGTTSSFPSIKRNGTGIDVRLADDSAFAPLAAATTTVNGTGAATSLTVTGGTLATNSVQALSVTGTQTSGQSLLGNIFSMIGAGTVGSAYGTRLLLQAGYTGGGSTASIEVYNNSAGVGTSLSLGTANAVPNANASGIFYASATTTGTNVGVYTDIIGGNTNYGLAGKAVGTKNAAANIGVLGVALNAGTTPIIVGGYFGMQSTEATIKASSVALAADNGAIAANIFEARDNGTAVFTIADGGNVTYAAGVGVKKTIPTADTTATGNTTNEFQTSYTTTLGDLVYLNTSGQWALVDANVSTGYDCLLGIVLQGGITSGNAVNVALPGSFIYMATAFPTFTIGKPIYMSETPGTLTQTAPSTSDVAIRVIGYAIHADKLYFFPSGVDYITHV